MRTSGSGLTRPTPRVEKLRTAQAREFKGGLNTFDTPLNMAPRYLTSVRNLYPDTNGRLRLRYGTSYHADVAGLSVGHIVNMEYFNASIVAVCSDGRIMRIDADGGVTAIWNETIVATKGTDPWSSDLTFVSFTPFGGQLVVCNGVDKPLVISQSFDVNYLADVGTASNVNVPRAKFCITHNNYLVLAGTPAVPDATPNPVPADFTTLYIGMRGTLGTFEGDPGADNDGVNFVTNTFVTRGSPDITGLGSFRDKLIVCYNEVMLAIQLGEYNTDDDHVPRVDDVIENHGAISHRCIVPMGDDILFMDSAGVSSVQRALITATLSPVRESTLISRDMQSALAGFTPAELDQYVFAVHDRIQQHVLFFVPKSDDVTDDQTVDNNVYVYCIDKSQRFRAWSYFDRMAFRCGCRTTEGRLFFAQGTTVYRYHNQYEPLYNDYATADEQVWAEEQWWDDGSGWLEPSTVIGQPIPFSMAIPWTDLKSPGMAKLSKYLAVQAEGSATFNVRMYIDDFPTPEMSMAMTMTEYPADSDFVLRPMNNAQLYAWPQKFEKMYIALDGESNAYIGIISIQVHYITGSVRR